MVARCLALLFLLLLLPATAFAAPAPVLLARDTDFIATTSGPTWCSNKIASVDVTSRSGRPLNASARQLQVFFAVIRLSVDDACPGVERIRVFTILNGNRMLVAEASAFADWILFGRMPIAPNVAEDEARRFASVVQNYRKSPLSGQMQPVVADPVRFERFLFLFREHSRELSAYELSQVLRAIDISKLASAVNLHYRRHATRSGIQHAANTSFGHLHQLACSAIRSISLDRLSIDSFLVSPAHAQAASAELLQYARFAPIVTLAPEAVAGVQLCLAAPLCREVAVTTAAVAGVAIVGYIVWVVGPDKIWDTWVRRHFNGEAQIAVADWTVANGPLLAQIYNSQSVPVSVTIDQSKAQSGEPNDPCRGLRDQLAEHRRKLADYSRDPFSHDNEGFLAAARAKGDEALVQKIIAGRKASLQRQIDNFAKQLKECEERNAK